MRDVYFTYFLSGGYLKSHPNGQVSQYGAYWTFPSVMPPGYPTGLQQLSGFGGLMGDPVKSQTATFISRVLSFCRV